MKRLLLFLILSVSVSCVAFELRNPMNIPIELSANFAELRPNHFHSGLDFKTEQQIGQPIYSVYDGYVSRVNISEKGYGNCLYINHPEIGLTSVYAHLDGFEAKIDSVIKAYQYDKEHFAVDFYLKPTDIPVKKGDLVAISGNSGSSGGPHLHFETRDLVSEDIIDPLFYYNVADNTSPRFHRIYVTPIQGEGTVEGNVISRGYSLEQLRGRSVKAFGKVGIGVRANDYMTGTGNIYGVHSLKVEVDGVTKFHYVNNRFSFDSTRYINSFIDYALWSKTREMVMKTYLPENCCMQYIAEQKDGGYIFVNEERDYKVKITISDFKGNSSYANFTIRGDSTVIPIISAYNGGKYFIWNMRNIIDEDGLYFDLPRGSLYNTLYFKYKHIPDSTSYSDAYQLHYATEPIQKYATIRIKVKSDTLSNKSQYYIANKGNGTTYSYVGGEYKDGYVECKTRSLGWYTIKVDRSKPAIKYLGKSGSTIKYTISDSGSGIGEFRGEVDGKWALFTYDAKYHLISYTFDSKRVTKGKNHKVIFTVYDKCGNVTKHSANIYW